jgi:methionyl-tRNA formyltransferase
MKMDAGLDTGDIVSLVKTPIAGEDDARTLHDRLAKMGAELLLRTIPDYVAGRIHPVPQPTDGACYARKLIKEDGRIDWSLPARAIWNRVRAFTPWPGAYTFQQSDGRERLLKLWRVAVEETLSGGPGTVIAADESGIVVACGRQALRIIELQREGGRRLSVAEFLAGNALAPGEGLGAPAK